MANRDEPDTAGSPISIDPDNFQRFHEDIWEGKIPPGSDLTPYNDSTDIATTPSSDGGEIITFYPRTNTSKVE